MMEMLFMNDYPTYSLQMKVNQKLGLPYCYSKTLDYAIGFALQFPFKQPAITYT